MYELRRDGGAPLRRPRVDAWALAATSAPSLLGLTISEVGPSATGAKQHKSRRFCLPATRGAGLVAALGWLGPKRPGAAPSGPSSSRRSLARKAITPRRGAAIALKGRRTALRRRLGIVFAVVVSDAADRRLVLTVSEAKAEPHPSRRASISRPV